jgi:hypothetical protein
MMTNPEYHAPAGPRWFPLATCGDIQADGRGTRWIVVRIAGGGRTLHWETCTGVLRVATTAAAPTHPDYPSDAAVLEYARAQKRWGRR